ncbi:MAG: helix-turn-helix transcriptional regulator [Proteobacteria bacterium]|nr:helix-turn-helix transcriptional regulator [Pseudomonadota bacterium]
MINERQCRAARAWLGLSQEELAEISKVSARTIAHFEAGNRVPHDRTLRDLQVALEEMGIEFLFEGNKGVGVRLRLAEPTQPAKQRTKE